MGKKPLKIVFFPWFYFAGEGDLCFDQSSGASNVERESVL